MTEPDPRLRRALVIDDEEGVRHLVCELLGLLGFEADGAASGPEGLAMFEHGAYDLVVTDLMMPRMTGWEVAERLRQRASTVGLIMATASVSNLDSTRARDLTLTFLAKPFQLRELREAVDAALQSAADRHVAGTLQSRGGQQEERLVLEAPVMSSMQDAPGALVGTLRGAAEAVRQAAVELDTLLGSAEAWARERDEVRTREAQLTRELQELREAHAALIREYESAVAALNRLGIEHDALRGEREASDRALAEARARYETLIRERRATADTIDAILLRLRR